MGGMRNCLIGKVEMNDVCTGDATTFVHVVDGLPLTTPGLQESIGGKTHLAEHQSSNCRIE